MKETESFSEQYENQGFLGPFDILSSDEILASRKNYQEYLNLLGSQPSLRQLAQLHLHAQWVQDLSLHPKIISAVKSILGENILVHGSTLFYKPPQDNRSVSWHQDGYFMQLSEDKFVTAWLALEDSKEENGCLCIIPCSHKKKESHEIIKDRNNILESGLTIPDHLIVGRTKKFLELKAGQISLHHVNLIHSSYPNRSQKPRVGLAVRYISTSVIQSSYHHPVLLASGKYSATHYQLQQHKASENMLLAIDNQRIAHNIYNENRSYGKV